MAECAPDLLEPSHGAMRRGLRRSVTLPQAVALYSGAVIGAGVLILPGLGAGEAGPASLLSWAFDCILGVPVALTFAALAARYPDAGGVATFATHAFGAPVDAVAGWWYFVATSVGQAVIVLGGAHYAADALALSGAQTFLVALGILVVAVTANLFGLSVSARLQLAVAAAVAVVLIATTVASIPHASAASLTPFMPHGWDSVGRTAVLVFFAFFGWEAITHLSAEFRDPGRKDGLRVSRFADGRVQRELIRDFSPDNRSFGYAILDAPGVRDSHGSFSVELRGDGSRVVWRSGFEPVDETAAQERTRMWEAVAPVILASLKQLVEQPR